MTGRLLQEEACSNKEVEYLTAKCALIRDAILRMIAAVGTGHPGSSLSCVEILVSLQYSAMRRGSGAANQPPDRFVLSKGHAAPALYAILDDLGLTPAAREMGLRQFGSPRQGHPDRRFFPAVEVSSGSLGQGLSIASGMALARRRLKLPGTCYALIGDGESQEGQVWEAAIVACALRLDNLCAITDYNGLQHDGALSDIVPLGDLAAKWRAFGWHTIDVNGHDIRALLCAYRAPAPEGMPKMIIARTVKGKGVPYMEGQWQWHSVTDAARLAHDYPKTSAVSDA